MMSEECVWSSSIFLVSTLLLLLLQLFVVTYVGATATPNVLCETIMATADDPSFLLLLGMVVVIVVVMQLIIIFVVVVKLCEHSHVSQSATSS
jgi:hypothetical protein